MEEREQRVWKFSLCLVFENGKNHSKISIWNCLDLYSLVPLGIAVREGLQKLLLEFEELHNYLL